MGSDEEDSRSEDEVFDVSVCPKSTKISFCWVEYLLSFRDNIVFLKGIFHYSPHINAIKGQNVCSPPGCSICPQEISVKIMEPLTLEGTVIKKFGKIKLL